MNSKIKGQYLAVYFILNIVAFLLAFKFWWTDRLLLNGLNESTLMIFFSVGISWIGILFLSIMITRILVIKEDNFSFISPLNLTYDSYYSEIGLEKAKKVKITFTVIAFPILFITIFSFVFLMRFYENYELDKNGVIENVLIKRVTEDVKHNKYALIEYKSNKHTIHLSADSLKENDSVKIIYSKRNPMIVKYYKDYNNKK